MSDLDRAANELMKAAENAGLFKIDPSMDDTEQMVIYAIYYTIANIEHVMEMLEDEVEAMQEDLEQRHREEWEARNWARYADEQRYREELKRDAFGSPNE